MDLVAIASALRNATYLQIGVSTFPPDPPNSPPCVLIAEPTVNSLSIAISQAAAQFGSESELAVYGGNVLMDVKNSQFKGSAGNDPVSRIMQPTLISKI
jgi:hypothetical protein